MQGKMEFQEIYENHSEQVYRYIYFLLREKELAEDLTQDVFLKVYRNLDQFNQEAAMATWILKIARNLTYDHLRRKRIVPFLPIEHQHYSSTEQSPEESFITKESAYNLYISIARLKRDYQEVLILRKINDFSIKETAEILGWTENKVQTKMARAFTKLKAEMLKQEGKFDEQSKRI
ncbi:RNA polymerase sigma factor [Planococcus sp. CAU13]|uniref:RNA polymerase sigma factor n=1 Tax=Planococcus sp. CAU13 TaxID=1541197 RepID=UPI00068FC3C4|nr:RNA polymerase sigma factor [Planococcus sp. CAU13]